MADYHPMDKRYKAPKSSAQDAGPLVSSPRRAKFWRTKTSDVTGTDTIRPWRTAAHEDVPAWENPGPIKEDLHVERRLREKMLREIEREEHAKIPVAATLFAPAALLYQFRAMLRARTATGHSPAMIAVQIAVAIVIYFGAMRADNAFGINAMLSGEARGLMTMQTSQPSSSIAVNDSF